jgi:glucose/arabinose dehydrogenase
MAALLFAATSSPALATDLEDPIPGPIQGALVPTVKLEPVPVTGLTSPVWGATAPAITDRLFVVDQRGELWSVNLATGAKSLVLDVGSRLVPLGLLFLPPENPFRAYDERGFLGVAFHPNYQANGLVYTFTSEPAGGGTPDYSTIPDGVDASHQNLVIEWKVVNPTVSDPVVDTNVPPRVLLRVDWPQFNHDGGALEFGPDGLLYIAFGDGGNEDDQSDGHGLIGNAQDPTSPLGKILRIDPLGNNSPNGQYGIPADNPFAGPGRTGYIQETYAYGFRNPYRLSFDSVTGDLFTGDVGQNKIEEVDVVVRGGNYGWNIKEGTFCFDPKGAGADPSDNGQVTDAPSCGPLGLINPVAQYDHDEGIAIVGGFVYRGARLPALRGRYVFSDYSRAFLANNGRLFFLKEKNPVGPQPQPASEMREMKIAGPPPALSMLGFGQDATGELYVLANTNGGLVAKDPRDFTGVIYRIAPAN